MTMTDQIIDCDGTYEVHPTTTNSWAVVNGEPGQVRCEFNGRDEAVAEAKALNA